MNFPPFDSAHKERERERERERYTERHRERGVGKVRERKKNSTWSQEIPRNSSSFKNHVSNYVTMHSCSLALLLSAL
jgi:hypothetical protein